MLIVPVGDGDSRRTLPWICIALILINTLVFAWTEHHDRQLPDPLDGRQYYSLADYEAPLLIDWLSQQSSRTYANAMAMPDRGPDFLFAYGWYNQAFTQYVHAHWQQHPPSAQWQTLRGFLEDWQQQQSGMRWGLIPNDLSLADLLSSQFLHGSWDHLLGNMIFLLLFGITMERYWGGWRFLLAYLVSGIGAGLLFTAAAPHSGVPLVGASGAISGLMGLFAGTFRLRKLEFFYNLGFLFGSFRAPALVLFPVWLGWELFQHLSSDNNVAYMAHAGGLLTGLAMAFLLPYTRGPQPEQSDTASSTEREVPDRCLQLAEQLNYADAQALCRQYLTNHPKSLPLWYFYLEMGSRQQQLDAAMKEAMKVMSNQPGSDALLGQLWKEFEHLGGQTATLPPAFQLLLAELAWRQQRRQQTCELLAQLQNRNWQHPRLTRLSQQVETG